MDNTSEKVCRVRTLVWLTGLSVANNSGLDISDLINEVQDFIMQIISPDKSLLYNTNHLGEKFYNPDPRWDALSYKPIRELTEEELKFGCTAVSTNGLVVYKLETERRALLKLVNSLYESLNHGEISNSEMDFIKRGILEGFDSIYKSDEHKDMERKQKAILREMKLWLKHMNILDI